MSCAICGRGSCIPMFHSIEEQTEYEPVIEMFDRARELREEIRSRQNEEED